MRDEIDDEDIIDRFNQKWEEDNNGCWIWQAYLHKSGYGVQTINNEPLYAHRVSHRIHKGGIPEDKYVLHNCDVKECVNPEHLYLGTQKENVQDAIERGNFVEAQNSGEENARKLTWDDVNMIRYYYENDIFTGYELTDMYPVSEAFIYEILNYNVWIPEE